MFNKVPFRFGNNLALLTAGLEPANPWNKIGIDDVFSSQMHFCRFQIGLYLKLAISHCIPSSQCANHLYANRNLRYSKWWPSFLLCYFWRVFSVYKKLILLWFCLLDSIFKQHYYLRRFVWSEVLCFSISCMNHQTWHEYRRITCLLVTWH